MPRWTQHLTTKILVGLLLGIMLGAALHYWPSTPLRDRYVLNTLRVLGQAFITLIKILVVPVVFFSLTAGVCGLRSGVGLGRIAFKTVVLYLCTTFFAIAMALGFAVWFGVGSGLAPMHAVATLTQPPTILASIKRIFLGNPIDAFMGRNMLQLIVIALIVGLLIRQFAKALARVERFVLRTNDVLMVVILWVMQLAPYGVFCLVSVLFARIGFELLGALAGYFAAVLFVLAVQWTVIYGLLLRFLARLNPWTFFKKMRAVILFAFSVSSSNATIPLTLKTCINALGIREMVAAFVIPLGATVNMDGSAIMQGVATVFVANLYGIHLAWHAYLLIMVAATLASIGAAGVPSAGLVTLAMVFQQVGLPVEGIAIILGVDRLLDMARTAVNVTGDATVACVVAHSER